MTQSDIVNEANEASALLDDNGEPDPRRTPHLVGHEAAQATLLAAQQSDALHHAWLICGARGIGKASLAWSFARYLLHYGNSDNTGDRGGGGLLGEVAEPVASLAVPSDSEAASLLRGGAHPDFLHIHPEWDGRTKRYKANLSVAALRGTKALFELHAAMRGWRVCLIDAADDMNQAAANALLKILEEPPAKAIFLIVSHQPGRLLPTIRSRCQFLRLQTLAQAQVEEILSWHLPELSADERARLARLGQGSAGQALALARSQGLEHYERLLEILKAMPQMPYESLYELVEKLGRGGAGGASPAFARFSELLLGVLQRCVREPLPDEQGAAEHLRSLAPPHRLAEAWGEISRTAVESQRLNLDGRQTVLTYFGTLAQSLRAG